MMVGRSKINSVANNSTIDRNDDDIEDIITSLNHLSIQTHDNLDIASHVQSSDGADNPTVI